jgi:hypothetical protein
MPPLYPPFAMTMQTNHIGEKEQAMSRYSRWQTGPGALTLSVRALRPFVMMTRLSLIANGSATRFSSTTSNGIDIYQLDAATVALLLTGPTSADPPSLLFSCAAVLHPAAQNRAWGWGIRLSRGAQTLLSIDDQGVALPLDQQGFRQTALRQFPAGKNIAAGLDLITLA